MKLNDPHFRARWAPLSEPLYYDPWTDRTGTPTQHRAWAEADARTEQQRRDAGCTCRGFLDRCVVCADAQFLRDLYIAPLETR